MTMIRRARLAALLPVVCGALLTAAPAAAQRGIVIDVAEQSNRLTDCGVDCYRLDGAVGSFLISSKGSIRLDDGSDATFFIAGSDTAFQVLSGYTFNGDEQIDFVDFYQAGRSLGVNESGNRDAPDFQILLRRLDAILEIGFNYWDFGMVPAGARIGYSGSTLGFGSSPDFPGETFGGFGAERFVTNANGLLLGESRGDSEFVFQIGQFQTVDGVIVAGLQSATFVDRYAAGVTPGVPEPATWAMMILGFGLVGGAARASRRRLTRAAV